MKVLHLISVVVVAACFTFSANATTYQFVGSDNSIETKICLAAVTNDKQVLLRKIRMTGKKVRIIASYLMCNDQIVANFAYKYGAQVTATYLDRYTPKKYKEQRPEVTIQDITAIQGKTTMVLLASK
jgi:hypothetical protein